MPILHIYNSFFSKSGGNNNKSNSRDTEKMRLF